MFSHSWCNHPSVVDADVYDAVMRRDRWCQASAHGFGSATACQGRLVVHHVTPKGMGGSKHRDPDSLDNLVVLCDDHHREVHANPTRSYDTGLLKRRNSL